MWSNLKVAAVNFLRCPEWAPQTKRTTFILKRKKPVRIHKLSATLPKKLLRREYYYELIEDTDVKKKPPLELVLTKDVAGLGVRGEKIEMNIYKAYRDLLLPKLAVYASSPEAQSLMKITPEKEYSSIYSKIVENYLAGQALKVIVSYETPWTLQPWHIKLALRQIGIFAKDDCISIPNTIQGPNIEIENKDFLIYLTMNKSERFPVRCRIYHWSNEDVTLNQKAYDLSSSSTVLFPEENKIIQSLIDTEKEIQMNRSFGGIQGKGIKRSKRRPKESKRR